MAANSRNMRGTVNPPTQLESPIVAVATRSTTTRRVRRRLDIAENDDSPPSLNPEQQSIMLEEGNLTPSNIRNKNLHSHRSIGDLTYCLGLMDYPDEGCPGRALALSDSDQCACCEALDFGGRQTRPSYQSIGKYVNDGDMDNAVDCGGMWCVKGSSSLVNDLTEKWECATALDYEFDRTELREAISQLIKMKVFTKFINGSSNNRGCDHFTTGLFHDRTKELIRQFPVLSDFLDALAPSGLAEVCELWLTCADPVSDNNPNGGEHVIHSDTRCGRQVLRTLTNLSDSDEGKVMLFQHKTDGRWAHVATPFGTTIIINEFGGGSNGSPVVHGILKGAEVFCLCAHVKVLLQATEESSITFDELESVGMPEESSDTESSTPAAASAVEPTSNDDEDVSFGGASSSITFDEPESIGTPKESSDTESSAPAAASDVDWESEFNNGQLSEKDARSQALGMSSGRQTMAVLGEKATLTQDELNMFHYSNAKPPKEMMPPQKMSNAAVAATNNHSPPLTPMKKATPRSMFPVSSTPAAAAVGGEAPSTDPIIVRTRISVGRIRREKRQSLSIDDRIAYTTALEGLHQPYNNTIVNEVMDMSNMSTPKRVVEVFELAKDMNHRKKD